jgi:hypothetical protein
MRPRQHCSAEVYVAQLDEETLATYLSDHLAGSVAALQLMDRICAAHGDGPIGLLMTRLRSDVAFEQTQVRQLLAALSAKESQVRRAVAWLGEQFLRFTIGAAGLAALALRENASI